MNKIIIPVLAITFVAVVMGLSTISPMIQYADAGHGKILPREVCVALTEIPDPPDAIKKLISEHCPGCPPNCGGGFSVESKTF